MAYEKEMVCKTCGSHRVRRDADVMWDVNSQKWMLEGIYDNATCDDCGGETTLVERPARNDNPHADRAALDDKLDDPRHGQAEHINRSNRRTAL